MKSNQEQLKLRGFAAVGIEENYRNMSFEQRISLLRSNHPIERTIVARLLSNHENFSTIQQLLAALSTEKKLYPKIEICNSLVSIGEKAVAPLIQLLGKIGNNQLNGWKQIMAQLIIIFEDRINVQ